MSVEGVGWSGPADVEPVDVFISYSHHDRKRAEELEALLRRHGKSVWRDVSLRAGENFNTEIPRRIRAAGTVVVLWSAHSARSTWVIGEANFAAMKGNYAPLAIEPFDFRRLDDFLGQRHCPGLLATMAHPEEFLARLAELALPMTQEGNRRRHRFDVTRLPETFASHLYGRERELNDLLRAWQSSGPSKTNIIAFDAIGGSGKTALIRRFIDMLVERNWLGAKAAFVWTFYSQGTDTLRPGSAEPFFDQALEFFGHDGSPLPSQHERGQRLADLVAQQRTLLVLDGLEPLQFPSGRSAGGRTAGGIAGSLKEPGISALLRQLARVNPGMLVVTTRLPIPELKGNQPRVVRYALARIPVDAGVDLLRSMGVRGQRRQLAAAVEELRGHALALSIAGQYLRAFFDGDIRRRDTMPPLAEYENREERDPFRVMQGYELQLRERARQQASDGDSPAARQLAVLYLLGLFDRPAERAAIDALLAEPPIVGLTDHLAGATPAQWDFAIQALRAIGLIAPKTADQRDLDAHPLIREYFSMRLRRDHRPAWDAAHRRLWTHYSATSGDASSVDDLVVVGQAITHAALAGEVAAAQSLYYRHIKPAVDAKGLYPLDITVLLSFFEEPWRKLVAGVEDQQQQRILDRTHRSLRAAGRLVEAVEVIEQSCALLRSAGSWRLYVDQKVEYIQVLIQLGRLRQAIAEADAALKVADEHRIAAQRPDILCYLGHAHHLSHHLELAKDAFAESEAAESDVGLPPSSFRQFAMNEYLLDQGRLSMAERRMRRPHLIAADQVAQAGTHALALSQLSRGRRLLLAAANADTAESRDARLRSAARYIDQALTNFRRGNHLDEVPRALILRAECRRAQGLAARSPDGTAAAGSDPGPIFDSAVRDLVEAMEIAEYCAMPLFATDACLEAVRLQWAIGSRVGDETASAYLDRAGQLIDTTGYERRRAELAELRAELPRHPDPVLDTDSMPTARADRGVLAWLFSRWRGDDRVP